MKSLIGKLKNKGNLTTLVGDFTFVRQLGEGGNSNVCQYKKNNNFFAIKFFSKGIGDDSKVNRFKDEFFGISQVPSHPNIASYYHLDKVAIDDEMYFIIIMKAYDSTLNYDITNLTDEKVYCEKVKVLFDSLLNGIEHLHSNGVIHRDIKPQNILVKESDGLFVLTDFGISKFDDDRISIEHKTRQGERLANYRYCAPEQRGKLVPASFSSDLYSFAQVIQEYSTGDINHGGGRKRIKFINNQYLEIVDKVIDRCLMHSPEDRFENVSKLREFINQEIINNKEEKDYREKQKWIADSWKFLHDFNHAIAKGFPSVKAISEISDPKKISYFLNCIDATINNPNDSERLWMIQSDGGDLNYYGSKNNGGNNFEISFGNVPHQAIISKILISYNESTPYKSFFIILIDKNNNFNYSDVTDLKKIKTRRYLPESIDLAVEWNGHYLDPDDSSNPYVEIEENVYDRYDGSFRELYRYVDYEALYVLPSNIFNSSAHINEHVEVLLNDAISNQSLSNEAVRALWQCVRGKYGRWITDCL